MKLRATSPSVKFIFDTFKNSLSKNQIEENHCRVDKTRLRSNKSTSLTARLRRQKFAKKRGLVTRAIESYQQSGMPSPRISKYKTSLLKNPDKKLKRAKNLQNPSPNHHK